MKKSRKILLLLLAVALVLACGACGNHHMYYDQPTETPAADNGNEQAGNGDAAGEATAPATDSDLESDTSEENYNPQSESADNDLAEMFE